jgi:hypothetical protein
MGVSARLRPGGIQYTYRRITRVDRNLAMTEPVMVLLRRTTIPLRRRRVDKKRKVHCRVHVRIDSGNVLNESVARAGKMCQASFQTG